MVSYTLSEIISKQPSINIGCIGHVSHGKSTLVKALSGTSTLRYAKERKKNSTIHLGYANMQIYKSKEDGTIYIKNSENEEKAKEDNLLKHISFVDCPGHQSYIANMLNGSSVMDFAFLVVDSTDPKVLQIQAIEHITALLVGGMENIVCIQNKIDLLSKDKCKENRDLISKSLMDEFDLKLDVIPVSSQLGYNVDLLKHFIAQIPEKISKKVNENLLIPIIRSFDINKPGDEILKLNGGVIGGSIIRGYCEIGDMVEIRPGLYNSKTNTCYPIVAKVETIFSETTPMDRAFPGGLIAVGLNIDPFLAKTNQLIGHTLGHYKRLPDIYNIISVKVKSLRRNKGKFTKGEEVKLHSLSYCEKGQVIDINKEKKEITIKLSKPICLEKNQNIAVFRDFDDKFILTHAGKFKSGESVNIVYEVDFEEVPIKTIEIENDLHEETGEIEINYEDLIDVCDVEKQENMLNMVYPSTIYQNRYTTLLNFREITKCLQSQTNNEYEVIEDRLNKHFKKEIAEYYSYDNENKVLFNKRVKPSHILDSIILFTDEYLKCKSCGSYSTKIIKEDRTCWTYCYKCKARHHVLCLKA
jgi:translation initiation factor 2 subunit 3